MTEKLRIVTARSLKHQKPVKGGNGPRISLVRIAKSLGKPYLEGIRILAREGETHSIAGEELPFAFAVVKTDNDSVIVKVKVGDGVSVEVTLIRGEFNQIYREVEDFGAEFTGFFRFDGVTTEQKENERLLSRVALILVIENRIVERRDMFVDSFVPYSVDFESSSVVWIPQEVSKIALPEDLLLLQLGRTVERGIKLDYVLGADLSEESVEQGNTVSIYSDEKTNLQLSFSGTIPLKEALALTGSSSRK